MRSASSLPSGTPICEWDKMPTDCPPFNPYLEDIIPIKIAGVAVLATHDLVGHHWTTSSLCHSRLGLHLATDRRDRARPGETAPEAAPRRFGVGPGSAGLAFFNAGFCTDAAA